MMGDHSLVDVDGALRRAGGAAREVEQGRIVRSRRRDLEAVVRLRHEPVERDRGVLRIPLVCQEHMPQPGQRVTDRGDLLLVEGGGRHKDARIAELEALAGRLGAERREQRREDTSSLERAERRGVQRRNTAGEAEDAFAALDAQPDQHVREPVGALLERRGSSAPRRRRHGAANGSRCACRVPRGRGGPRPRARC